MGLWHRLEKEDIVKGFWDQKFYDSANDLQKKYYKEELEAFAAFLNADSLEEHEENASKFLTAMRRKNYAGTGLLTEEEINRVSISRESALKVLKGGFQNGMTNFAILVNPTNYKIETERMMNMLSKNLNPQENVIMNEYSAILDERHKNKVLTKAQDRWKNESVEELTKGAGMNSTRTVALVYNQNFSRMENKVQSMRTHLAKALKTEDRDAALGELSLMLVDYTNLRSLRQRPDQPDEVLFSENESLTKKIEAGLKSTYDNAKVTNLKLDLWRYLDEDSISEIFRNIGIEPELPQALKNEEPLNADELDWYSCDREKCGELEFPYKREDGFDDIRQEKIHNAGFAIYDIRTSPNEESFYKHVTDYVLAKRELERFEYGFSQEKNDPERLHFHNEEDYPLIYEQVKADFQGKSLYEMKAAFYSGKGNYARELHEKLNLDYELFTEAYFANDYFGNTNEVKTWDTIKQEDAERKAKLEAERKAAEEQGPEEEEEGEPEPVETEEEIKAREKAEKLERRLDSLEEKKQSAAKGLSGEKLQRKETVIDSLKTAVSSENPQEIIKGAAKALSLEYGSSLRKADAKYSNGANNIEENAGIFEKTLREAYTDEQLLSDDFKDKLTDPSVLSTFKTEVSKVKEDIYALQIGKLKEALTGAGINPDNKFSLLRLSIIAEKPATLDKGSGRIACMRNMADIAELRTRPAFGLSENGKVMSKLYPDKTMGASIEEKCSAFDGFHANTMNNLFKAMAEGRLVIEPTDGNPESTRFVTMGAKGPVVTKTVKELKADLKEKKAGYEVNGFPSAVNLKKTLGGFDKIVAQEARLSGLIQQNLNIIRSEEYLKESSEDVVRGDLVNLHNRINNTTRLREMFRLDDGKLTRERLDQEMPKSPKEQGEEICSQILEGRVKEEPQAEIVKEEAQKEPVKAEPVEEKQPELQKEEPKAPEEEKPAYDREGLSALLKNAIGADSDEELRNALDSGYITTMTGNDRLGIFRAKESLKETLDDLHARIAGGENLVLSHMDTESKTIRESKLTLQDGSFGLKKLNPLVSEDKRTAMETAISVISEAVSKTGITRGDSDEFKEFKSVLSGLSGKKLPQDKAQFDSLMDALHEKASGYFFAKLDQSHNKTRLERFTQAATALELIDAYREGRRPTKENMYKSIIAAKGLKAKLMKDLKSGDERSKQIAAEQLGDRSKFEKSVKALCEKPAFKERLKNFDEKALEKMALKTGKEVDKAMKKDEGMRI